MLTCDMVDVFVGTDNLPEFGNGNVLPLLAMPWGSHHFAPCNAALDRWFFQYRARDFAGLRLTHQPSPWIGDWCHATVMPQSGARRCRRADRCVEVPSVHIDMRPHRFACHLATEGITIEAAPTMHGLAMDLVFQGSGPRRILLDGSGGDRGHAHAVSVQVDPDQGLLLLTTRPIELVHQDFAMHLVLQVDAAVIGGGTWDGTQDHAGQYQTSGIDCGGWLELTPGTTEVRIRAAGSFIDREAAQCLLQSELAGRSLVALQQGAAAAWNALLGRIELPQSDAAQRALVATMAYRTLLFPRRLDEPSPSGGCRHRCPDTGAVRSGVRVTDNGFWDTARTVYPWYSLFCPDHLPTILDGWLEGARSSGWLASWASPGHRTCMTGSYIDAVFADAVARDIGGFDPAEAVHYLRRHVEDVVPDDAPYGRIALDAYLKHHYVPIERIDKAVARTLDYAYGDWCIAQVADAAGDTALAERCRQRAGNWRQVLCPESGFFRGRHADGRWLSPFDPHEWGGPYVEGSAWQFAWHVPHHAPELIAARGGPETARTFLQRLLDEPPIYRVGTYGQPIHEMCEMASVDFGQYAHSNQPSHFALPYLAHCGDAAAWAQQVKRVCTELHTLQPDGLPGDEDNGEMSAWWLCAALGLFPHCPGESRWLAVTPLLPGARINVPGRAPIEPGRWPTGTFVDHAQVLQHGEGS